MPRKRPPTSLLVAWVVYLGFVAVTLASSPGLEVILGRVADTLLVVVGSVIIMRTEQKTIGWILVFLGAAFTLVGGVLIAVGPDDIERYLNAGIGMLTVNVYLILIFPSGRLENTFSKAIVWVSAAGGVAIAWITWPTGPPGPDDEYIGVLFYGVMMIAAVGAQIGLRHRRTDVERRQIKWFIYALSISAAMYVTAAVLGLDDVSFLFVDAVATMIWPLAILVAMTRFRLYEIDRIVSRTVSYALVVGFLAGVFLALVATVTLLLPTQNSLAIAAATLAVAALFNPVRLRIQHWIDRRFNRSQYEAEEVVRRFTAGINDQVDVELLISQLQGLVIDTMSPAAFGAWDNTSRDDDRE